MDSIAKTLRFYLSIDFHEYAYDSISSTTCNTSREKLFGLLCLLYEQTIYSRWKHEISPMSLTSAAASEPAAGIPKSVQTTRQLPIKVNCLHLNYSHLIRHKHSWDGCPRLKTRIPTTNLRTKHHLRCLKTQPQLEDRFVSAQHRL